MDTRSFIIQRQIHWAKRHGIPLSPAKSDPTQVGDDHVLTRGLRAYTKDLRSNLFEPLSRNARVAFSRGDGDEMEDKMRAVHSSSALGVNLFHYWHQRGLLADLANVLEIPSPRISGGAFEEKRPVMTNPDRKVFPRDPNLDFVFTYSDGGTLEVAVECKFTEPFGQKHDGLKQAYLDQESLWKSIPQLHCLAKEISPNDECFVYLHAAQLLKHILGLLHRVEMRSSGKTCSARLLYLYYDVTGAEGRSHAEEVEQFAALVRKQFPERKPIIFQYTTYQEALMRLAMKHRDQHPAYLDWMLERYL
ncbi:MAG: hypothetical protein FJ272_10350 [Planctomycetes bacterium]|nr:hypothetical protein [Planctomycetota bacterium]